MAKSSTKKRKVVVESNGEAHIVASFNNIIISLPIKMVTLFPGHQLVKWDLEELKEYALCSTNGSGRCCHGCKGCWS